MTLSELTRLFSAHGASKVVDPFDGRISGTLFRDNIPVAKFTQELHGGRLAEWYGLNLVWESPASITSFKGINKFRREFDKQWAD